MHRSFTLKVTLSEPLSNSLHACGDFCRLNVVLSGSKLFDTLIYSVPERIFWKNNNLKKSADDTKSMNYYSTQKVFCPLITFANCTSLDQDQD